MLNCNCYSGLLYTHDVQSQSKSHAQLWPCLGYHVPCYTPLLLSVEILAEGVGGGFQQVTQPHYIVDAGLGALHLPYFHVANTVLQMEKICGMQEINEVMHGSCEVAGFSRSLAFYFHHNQSSEMTIDGISVQFEHRVGGWLEFGIFTF